MAKASGGMGTRMKQSAVDGTCMLVWHVSTDFYNSDIMTVPWLMLSMGLQETALQLLPEHSTGRSTTGVGVNHTASSRSHIGALA